MLFDYDFHCFNLHDSYIGVMLLIVSMMYIRFKCLIYDVNFYISCIYTLNFNSFLHFYFIIDLLV